jgi:hypothetical protein
MENRYSQIKFFAANYTRLQGMRAIPVGLLAVFVSVWALYNQGTTANLIQPILAAVATALLYWWTDRYYNRTFGQIKPSPNRRKVELIVSAIGSAVALLAFMLEIARILPVSPLGLVFAASFLEYFSRVDKAEWGKIFIYFPENIIASIFFIIISILPLFGINVWEAIAIKWQIVGIFLIYGIVIIVTGIVGHLRITRELPTMEAKPDDNTL